MDIIDIKTYMQSVGREARLASRLVAKAETAAKNRSLEQMAAAIKRDEQVLLAANAMDVESAAKRGLDSAVRYTGRQDARAARRYRDHLRSPAQRYGRCRRVMP